MRKRLYLVLVGLLAVPIKPAFAQENLDTPAFNIPKTLEPYMDETRVLNSAQTVLAMMQSAIFERNSGEFDIDGKKTPYDEGLKGECDTEEYQSFYRGIHLAHLGYSLFLSKQESGWLEDRSAVADWDTVGRHFTSYGRNVLLRNWPPSRLAKLLEFASSLTGLPDERKSDLAVFRRGIRTPLLG